MLFHFPVDAHVIFCIIELTLEALFKNMTRFWNERSTILLVPTLKLEMFRSHYQIIVEPFVKPFFVSIGKCFWNNNRWSMRILCILFQMSIRINYELWIFQAFTREFIKYIYIYIFPWKFNLLKILFYPRSLLISNFCDFYL